MKKSYKSNKEKEIKLIFVLVAILFAAFLVIPVVRFLGKSFIGEQGVTAAFYTEVFQSRGFLTALKNSFLIAGTSALVTTVLAFLMAYTVHYTNVNRYVKKLIGMVAMLPIDYIDPEEGNYSLTESVAVLKKDTKREKIAMDMAECIIKKGRARLQETYPNALYEGETTDPANASTNPKVFPEKLTVDLLKRHQDISEASKK